MSDFEPSTDSGYLQSLIASSLTDDRIVVVSRFALGLEDQTRDFWQRLAANATAAFAKNRTGHCGGWLVRYAGEYFVAISPRMLQELNEEAGPRLTRKK